MTLRQTMIAAFLVLGGCASSPEIEDNPLAGTSWTFEWIGGQTALADQTATLTFESPVSISGDTGCNSFLAGVLVQDYGLRFGRLASTRMACPGALGEQEARLLDLLSSVGAYRLENGALLLLAADGRRLLRLSQD